MRIPKTRTVLTGLALVAALMSSCSKDQTASPSPSGQVAARFVTAPNLNLKTAPVVGDSSVTHWIQGDKVGICMLKADTVFSLQNALPGSFNLPFVAVPDAQDNRIANFTAQAAPLYYPQDGSDVNFVAYYPYEQSFANTIDLDVSDQTAADSQSQYDLLYAASMQHYNKTSGLVALDFKHALAKMLIYITPKTAGGLTNEDLVGMTVTISGLSSSASINPFQQTMTLGAVGDIKALTDANATLAQAIIIPQLVSSSVTLTFTLADNAITQADNVAGSSFSWTASMMPVFMPANQYIFQIQLTRNNAQGTGTIIDWTNNAMGGGIAN